MRSLELLAPARNADIGIAAIDCGADAVYIAGPRFGARQAAGNSIEDIAMLCRYAHQYGAKIFVTLNTIIYDEELDDAAVLMDEIAGAGADAIIVQDMAIIGLLRKRSDVLYGSFRQPDRTDGGILRGHPDDIIRTESHHSGVASGKMPVLHASTQCAIRTVEKAKELEALGFSRIVLERELSLRQIREIASAVNCEIEFFVHGALCVCYSGQCYLSERIAGRSANRGACIQACRSRYDLTDSDGHILVRDKALLSLKDYNLSGRLEDLADAGVMSFKIEGRLKNISYVRNTVRAYSLALDRLVEQSGGKYRRASYGRVTGGFVPDLHKTFNRGYTELFLDGKRGKWAAMDSAKSMGEELGTVTGLNRDRTSFSIRPVNGRRLRINNGDGLAFIGRNGEVEGVRADVGEGLSVRCKSTPALFEGAKIFRNYDIAFEKGMNARPCVRRINAGITVSFIMSDGTHILSVKAWSENGREAVKEYEGLWQEMAANMDRMEAMIRTQLSRTSGIYAFRVDGIVHDGTLPLLSSATLNHIRNDIADTLSLDVLSENPDNILINGTDMDDKTLKMNGQKISGTDTGNRIADYKTNVANRLAEELYSEAGYRVSEPAYELTHRNGAELMRTKYCIRYELGLCPRHHAYKTFATSGGSSPQSTKIPALQGVSQKNTHGSSRNAAPLYLLNNGRKLSAIFDCRACEMVIKTI